jgi:hypothetical protein
MMVTDEVYSTKQRFTLTVTQHMCFEVAFMKEDVD